MAGPRRPPRASSPAAPPARTRPATGSTRTATAKTATTTTAKKPRSTPATSKPASAASSPSARSKPSKSGPAKVKPAPTRSSAAKATKATKRASGPSSSSGKALARVDSPAGSRAGTTDATRKLRSRRRARLMVGLALTVLLVGVVFVVVLPTPTWLQQRDDTARLEAELAEVQADRAAVAAEIERLGTDSEIEAQARRNGYVQPGEEAYNILPSPVEPIGLPDTWPFTGVEAALGVR